MAKKIIVPEEELHDIADAINNRADYLDDIDQDTHNRNSLLETENRQMESKNMAANILSLSVNLRRYYTKDEIDNIITNDTARIVYVSGELDEVDPTERDERTLYLKKYDTDRYAIWVWKDNKWQLAGGNVTQEDLDDNYYTKAYIDECCNSKQDVLVPGDNITIDENNRISASFDARFKLKASMETAQGDITQGTLQKYDNPNNDPVFAILGNSPIFITLDTNNKGYIVVNLDPDKLEGSANIPLDDESTKVATTEFVVQKIEEAMSGNDDIVRYMIFETSEEESMVTKEDGNIYVNKETNEISFGNTLLNGLLWNIIDTDIEYQYLYIKYSSGFIDLDDTVNSRIISSNIRPSNYTDIFYDPWQDTQTIGWNITNLSDPSKTIQVPNNNLDISSIIEQLEISSYGDSDNPAISCSPIPYPLPQTVPWVGYSAGSGRFVALHENSQLSYASEPAQTQTTALLGDSISLWESSVVKYPGYSFKGWCTIEDGYIDEELTPQELGFKVNPSIIDWSWTGQLYPIWEENSYSTIQDAFNDFENPVFGYVVDYNQSNMDIIYNDDQSRRYVIKTIAQQSNSQWALTSDFEDLSDLNDITRNDILNNVQQIIEDLDLESSYIYMSGGSPRTEVIPSNSIFMLYVQTYDMIDDELVVTDSELQIFKGWNQGWASYPDRPANQSI